MGFFGQKPEKRKGASKFKTLSVSLSHAAPKAKRKAAPMAAKTPGRKMGFDEWLEHYAAMSNGNPV